MSLKKKMRDEQDKKVLYEHFGKKPKHRCSVCHRFSLFNYNDPKLKEFNGCVMCYLIDQTKKEKEKDGEGKDIKSEDSGIQQ